MNKIDNIEFNLQVNQINKMPPKKIRGIAMSALALMLSTNVNASLIGASQETICLLTEGSSVSSNNQRIITSIKNTIEKINDEICIWRENYKIIDESKQPDLYFSKENIAQLNDSDIGIRSYEQILRIQHETVIAQMGDFLAEDVNLVIRQLRIAIAKLRMAISDILLIEKQLHKAKALDKSSFDMNNNVLQSLKVSTVNTYYH